VACTRYLERHEGASILLTIEIYVRIDIMFGLRSRLQARLEFYNRAIEARRRQDSRLEGSAIETWTVTIEALADNFTAPDDDRTMAIVQW